MEIEIINDDFSQVSGNKILVDNKRIQNVNSKGFRPTEFSEDEILFILGDKNFEKYEQGKYIFNIPKWQIDIISGNGLKNCTPYQNKWSYNYQQIK